MTFFVSVGVIAAAIATTVFIARTRATPFDFSLQGAKAPAAKSFDHFDFSSYWLATHGQPNLALRSQAAILVDLDTRQVLWSRDPETSRAPASLTKLVTAMVAVDDAGSLDRMVDVTKQATQVVPSVMGLTPGEQVTVRELIDGMFLDSGNDAAEALASGLVPRERFIRQMNQKAKSIGLTASHFATPSGLDTPGHGMSAHDLAHTAAYLDAYYPQLAAIAATKDIVIPATSTHKAFYPHNLNRLLWTYPGATGLKTGLTDNAGGCMLATATRGGRHLIAVVLNATGHSTDDAVTLLNYGFSVHPTRAFGPFGG
ncbi:MAG: D-alanyl-D-alanine carboxypeptidase [Chloroflexi bacterium]|nr:MAG: D-alanyl-D-alanine carboxypeptidase [Chloroflexota bacterium]TMF39145.1 MAG: D-alanyl-D-alanine carboxypeptidase [Chloroflexota bacterium]